MRSAGEAVPSERGARRAGRSAPGCASEVRPTKKITAGRNIVGRWSTRDVAIAHHLVFRLADDRVIAADAPAFRRAARCFHLHGRPARLLGFCVVDTHAHALVACEREPAIRFARGVAIALQKSLRPGAPFERTRVKQVVDQRHLYGTFHYILRQHQHHGMTSDPFHDGSHLPDVAGFRLIGGALEAAVRGHLPRLELTLPPRGELVASHLVDGGAAALALPDLRGKSPTAVLGRAAVVQVALPIAAAPIAAARELADLLAIGHSTVNRLRHAAVPRALLRAVEGQARWRAAVTDGTVA